MNPTEVSLGPRPQTPHFLCHKSLSSQILTNVCTYSPSYFHSELQVLSYLTTTSASILPNPGTQSTVAASPHADMSTRTHRCGSLGCLSTVSRNSPMPCRTGSEQTSESSSSSTVYKEQVRALSLCEELPILLLDQFPALPLTWGLSHSHFSFSVTTQIPILSSSSPDSGSSVTFL